jgi:hypothetical protein
MAPGGGFSVTVAGHNYPVESSYSFPHGGENRLAADVAPAAQQDSGEATWHVSGAQIDDQNYEVSAAGSYYSIRRRITLHPNRIVVSDAIRNKTDRVLGIILANHIKTDDRPGLSVAMPGNYTLFLSAADHGLTLVGLDDLYQLQQHTYHRAGVAAMVTDKLGLDAGASYTIQWAVYPTATGDYLDFVNTFRRVERLDRTVDGAFALVGEDGRTGPDVRGTPVPAEVIRAKGVKYVSYFYLIAPPDDPGMSLEGIEFTEYPQESALLRQSIAETHRLSPGVKVMFHVAHGLYLTNDPEGLFPDCRVIRADGKQIFYGPDTADYYCQFISRQRFDQGYRWYIFYPTLQNAFGKALLDAIDYMLEETDSSADTLRSAITPVDTPTTCGTGTAWRSIPRPRRSGASSETSPIWRGPFCGQSSARSRPKAVSWSPTVVPAPGRCGRNTTSLPGRLRAETNGQSTGSTWAPPSRHSEIRRASTVARISMPMCSQSSNWERSISTSAMRTTP